MSKEKLDFLSLNLIRKIRFARSIVNKISKISNHTIPDDVLTCALRSANECENEYINSIVTEQDTYNKKNILGAKEKSLNNSLYKLFTHIDNSNNDAEHEISSYFF